MNGEFSKYTRTVIELSQEEDLEVLGLTGFVKDLVVAYDRFKEVYKKNRGSLLTPEMVLYDNQRDNGLKLLQREVKLIADFAREETDRNQANLIFNAISKHGKEIYNMSYNQQGGEMDEIIEDLETKPVLYKALDDLHQRKYFNEMRETHQAFDKVYKAYILTTDQNPVRANH